MRTCCACPDWKAIIDEVKATGKRFQFKQGLDERLLTESKVHELMSWKYDGDYIFAFDNIEDRPVIESKLQMIRKLYPDSKKTLKFYVLVGFDRGDKYDGDFWLSDVRDTFERIKVLSHYGALPYIMRFEATYQGPYKQLYSNIAAWCNQPSFFKKLSFREFCIARGLGRHYGKYSGNPQAYLDSGGRKYSSWLIMEQFEQEHPEIAATYFDMKFGD